MCCSCSSDAKKKVENNQPSLVPKNSRESSVVSVKSRSDAIVKEDSMSSIAPQPMQRSISFKRVWDAIFKANAHGH